MLIESISENASAGSGKTTELVKRYIKLLYNGVSPEDIYCITFTNKATYEMKNRILDTIENLATGCSDTINIIKELDVESDAIKKRFRKISGEIYQTSIHISTIDAFLLSILRSFTFEASVPYEFDIAGRSDFEFMWQETVRWFVDEIYKSENRQLAEELFQFGVSIREKDILKFLSKNLLNLFNIRAEFEEIKLRYDLKDFQKNLNERLNMAYIDLMKTRDALSRFLLAHIDKIGKRSHSTVEKFGREDSPKRLASLFSKDITELSTYKKLLNSIESNKFIDLWNRFKKSLGNYFEIRIDLDQSVFLYLIRMFETGYEKIIKKYKKLSFSDIENAVYNLLVVKKLYQYPEYLYFRLDYKFKHLLIDEFQDTSFMQWAIIEPIAAELVSGVGIKESVGSFFYVGDPKQSIYRFRGAASGLFDYPSNMLNMTKKTLSTNYRSDRSLVEFYNKIFGEFSKSVAGFDYESVNGNSSEAGYVYAEIGENYDTGQILAKIVESISRMHEAGFMYSDITILTEKNKEVDIIADYLTSKEIPVSAETTSSLFYTDLAQIIISVLRYIERSESIYKEQIAYLKISDFNGKIAELKSMAGIYSNLAVLIKTISLFDLDSYFHGDENLYKIIDVAFSANDEATIFDDFVDRFEAMLKNCNKLNQTREHSIKIMTIHKSKGLEFDAVILPIFPSSASRNGIIVSRNNDFRIDSLVLSITQKMLNYSEKLKKIYEKEKQDSLIDELNRFYVATTRARHALIVFGSDKKPIFCKLKGCLKNRYEKGTLIARSNANDYNSPKKEYFLEKIKETDDSGKAEVFGSFKERLFGEAFHFAAETIEEFNVSRLDGCIDKVRRKYLLFLSEEDINEIRERMINLLENKEFMSLISGKVFREKSFIADGNIRRIDLYAIQTDKINIIDYKTHYEKLFLDRYRKQLYEYEQILSGVYEQPIQKYLVFAEKTVRIVQL